MKKNIGKLVSTALLTAITLGCASNNNISPFENSFGQDLIQASKARNSASQSFWQDQIIYFIFTDRFANGDRKNDFNVKTGDPWAYHGGDFQGIIDKLDYIKDLGATAIWITPPMDNRDNAFKADFGGGKMQDIWGYHGYWTKDFYAVDEHLGDMNKMKELVKKAHAKGIKVLIDIVMNHLDYDHEFAKNKNNPADKYHKWFNHHGKINDNEWNNPWKVEHGELAELPDLDQKNEEVYKYLLEASKWWIKQTGADGFRLDTVKHVGHDFWKRYARDIKAFAGQDFLLLGEVYDGRPEINASYIRDGLDSTFDFPFYYAIKDVFGQGKSMRQLANLFDKDHLYPNPNMLSPFIDNHDVARFIHDAGGSDAVDKLRLAMAFIMTMRGMPMIYYGTEVALPGGNDPDNRKDMQFSRNPALVDYVRWLATIRKSYPALRRGKQLEMWQDEQVYSYLRTTGEAEQEVITVLNNSNDYQTRVIPVRAESKMANGAKLYNLIGRDTINVNNRSIEVKLAPKEAKVYSMTMNVSLKRK